MLLELLYPYVLVFVLLFVSWIEDVRRGGGEKKEEGKLQVMG